MRSPSLAASSLSVTLALAGCVVAAAALPEIAWAQSAAVFEGGVYEVIPASGVTGDGASPADIYLLALAADGTPLTGIKGKPISQQGTCGDVVELGGGLYRFTFTAAKVADRTTATVSLKAKVAGVTQSKSWSVLVSPPRNHAMAIIANPPRMTLGQDRTATISINLSGGDRAALERVELAVRASAGTVENLTNLGGGQFTALFTAPSVNYPQVAQLTVVDKRDPARTYGTITVPLVGKVDYPVQVAPGARVMMKVGDQQFGPIQSDAQGRARVPILVPPGAAVAEKIVVGADGKSTSEPLDLKVPESRRISLFSANPAIPSDNRVTIPVRAVVTRADGSPDGDAQVSFTSSAGTISPGRHEGGGVYVANFTPPTGNVSTQATISASLLDKPQLQADAVSVNLVPARPAKVELTSEPSVLGTGADGFKVYAKVTGPDGSGLGARSVDFAASGAKLRGDVKDLRNGDYQGVFQTTGNGPVELSATVGSPVTGNPASRVLLVPSKRRLPSDGLSSTMLSIATVDEFGYPVPNVAVSLRLTTGDGSIPAQAKTGSNGLAQVYYTAGRRPGMINVEATAADMVAATTLLQAPPSLALPSVPVSGPKAEADLVGEWRNALGDLRIEREGMQGAIIGPMTSLASAAGRPTKAAMVSDPATVSAGGSVTIGIKLLDESGNGVGGQQLDFLTSSGVVSGMVDQGGGNYQARLDVPANASGDVMISVATRDGTVSSFMRVPIGGADAAWTSSPFTAAQAQDTSTASSQPVAVAAPPPQPAPQPVAQPVPATQVAVKKSPPPSDHPWIRASAGYVFAGYDYAQGPLTKNTVLYPKQFNVSATSSGIAADVRAFLPMFRYVGAEVGVRSNNYSIDPTALCAGLGRPCDGSAAVPDWYTAFRAVAIGRYVFDVGDNAFHVGARAGFSESDVQVFTVVNNASIVLDQLPLAGMALGAELGAEIGRKVFMHTDFTESLAGGSVPYNHEFGVEIGYAFVPNLFAAVGYDLSIRESTIQNASGAIVGEVSDSFHGLGLDVGVQF